MTCRQEGRSGTACGLIRPVTAAGKEDGHARGLVVKQELVAHRVSVRGFDIQDCFLHVALLLSVWVTLAIRRRESISSIITKDRTFAACCQRSVLSFQNATIEVLPLDPECQFQDAFKTFRPVHGYQANEAEAEMLSRMNPTSTFGWFLGPSLMAWLSFPFLW